MLLNRYLVGTVVGTGVGAVGAAVGFVGEAVGTVVGAVGIAVGVLVGASVVGTQVAQEHGLVQPEQQESKQNKLQSATRVTLKDITWLKAVAPINKLTRLVQILILKGTGWLNFTAA